MINEESGGIVWIDIRQLYPHPDNPRKDLGDLGELTESIKAKGIMQNLTVVRGHRQTHEEWEKLNAEYDRRPSEDLRVRINSKWRDDGYTVIIGHRRTEAARRAGMTSLPCIIADMTPAEQVQTMLLENMQRSDLTVYEQAQGFQMMLDFGDSVDTISHKTGFSESTVRKRLKMAKLDREILKDISLRQPTLADFERLYELDSIDAQNECLKEIGTANYNQKLQYALKKQNIAKMLPRIMEEIKKLHATKINRSEAYGCKYVSIGGAVLFYNWDGKSPLIEKIPDKKLYYWLDEDYGHVGFCVEAERAQTVRKTPEELKKAKLIAETWNRMDQLCEDAYNLRRQFIDQFTVTTRNYDKVMDGAYSAVILRGVMWLATDSHALQQIAGTQNEPHPGADRKTIKELKDKPELKAKVIYCTFADGPKNGYVSGYRQEMPHPQENLPLDVLYDWLIGLGYEMSDDEKALREYTHDVFGPDAAELFRDEKDGPRND